MKQESIKEFQIVGAAVKKVPNPQWCLHLASRGGELLPQAIKKKQTNKQTKIFTGLFPASHSQVLPVFFPEVTPADFETFLF